MPRPHRAVPGQMMIYRHKGGELRDCEILHPAPELGGKRGWWAKDIETNEVRYLFFAHGHDLPLVSAEEYGGSAPSLVYAMKLKAGATNNPSPRAILVSKLGLPIYRKDLEKFNEPR